MGKEGQSEWRNRNATVMAGNRPATNNRAGVKRSGVLCEPGSGQSAMELDKISPIRDIKFSSERILKVHNH